MTAGFAFRSNIYRYLSVSLCLSFRYITLLGFFLHKNGLVTSPTLVRHILIAQLQKQKTFILLNRQQTNISYALFI